MCITQYWEVQSYELCDMFKEWIEAFVRWLLSLWHYYYNIQTWDKLGLKQYTFAEMTSPIRILHAIKNVKLYWFYRFNFAIRFAWSKVITSSLQLLHHFKWINVKVWEQVGISKNWMNKEFLVDNSRIFVRNVLPTTGFQLSSFFIVNGYLRITFISSASKRFYNIKIILTKKLVT